MYLCVGCSGLNMAVLCAMLPQCGMPTLTVSPCTRSFQTSWLTDTDTTPKSVRHACSVLCTCVYLSFFMCCDCKHAYGSFQSKPVHSKRPTMPLACTRTATGQHQVTRNGNGLQLSGFSPTNVLAVHVHNLVSHCTLCECLPPIRAER